MRGVACAKTGGSAHPILGEWDPSNNCNTTFSDYISNEAKITPNLIWYCDICTTKLDPEAMECSAPECTGETDGSKVARTRIVESWVSAVEAELVMYESKEVTQLVTPAEVMRLLTRPHEHADCKCILSEHQTVSDQEDTEMVELERLAIIEGLNAFRETQGPASMSSLGHSEPCDKFDMSIMDADLGEGERDLNELSRPEIHANLAKRTQGVQNMDATLELAPGAMTLIPSFHSSLNYFRMLDVGFLEKWMLDSLDEYQSKEFCVLWMALNYLAALDPGAVLPLWVPKNILKLPQKLIETRVQWLRNLAERPAPPLGNWELLPAFKAQRDFRQRIHDRKTTKRKAFKELKSTKVKQARLEAGVAPKMNERGLAQTISLSFKQLLVFGNRYKNLKNTKVSPPEQQPSDDQLARTVLDGMNIVILDDGAPDQVMEDASNEVIVVGDNHGDVVSLSDPGNEVQTDTTTSEEQAMTTEVSHQIVSSPATDSSTPIVPGPSGSKANAKEPPQVSRNERKPSKPNSKELVGDRNTKSGNGKKTEGNNKANRFQARVEPAYVNPNNRWI